MITNDGKTHIKRYMAGFAPAIAQSIAFGVGEAAEAVGDTKLQFEVGRADINLTSYDFVNNKLIFKAPVSEALGGRVYEVALYSTQANAAAGEFGSRILTTFDSATEAWVDATSLAAATFSGTYARVGAAAVYHNPAASGTKTDKLTDISLDLSGYSAADKFALAYYAGSNVSSVRIRFLTDTSNYYEVNFGTPTTGYKVTEITKGAAVATGAPNWANITEIRATTIATAGGAAVVHFDGLRIEDSDTVSVDYVMVSRELLATPFTKQEGMSQEVEFTMDVSIP